MFKTPIEGSWKCQNCFVRNTSNANACICCKNPKPCVEQQENRVGLFTFATPSETGATAAEPFSVAVKPQDGKPQSVQPGSGNIPTAPSTKAASGGFSSGSAFTSQASSGFVFAASLHPFSVAPRPKDGGPQPVQPASGSIPAVSSNTNSNIFSGFSLGSVSASPASSSAVSGTQKPKDGEPQPVQPASESNPAVFSVTKAFSRLSLGSVSASPASSSVVSGAQKPKDGEPQPAQPARGKAPTASSFNKASGVFSLGSAITSPASGSFMFGALNPDDGEPQPVQPASGNIPTASSNSKAFGGYSIGSASESSVFPASLQCGTSTSEDIKTYNGRAILSARRRRSRSKTNSQSNTFSAVSLGISSDNTSVASSGSVDTLGSANTLAVAKSFSSCGSPDKNLLSNTKGRLNDKGAPTTVTATEHGFQFGSTPANIAHCSTLSSSTCQRLTSENTGPKETECPVCRGHFTVPKILPCGHDLCRDCLLSRLKECNGSKCPLCRFAIIDLEQHASKSGDATADVSKSRPLMVSKSCVKTADVPSAVSSQVLETVVDGLPTDLAMEALVESTQVLGKDHVCCVCDGVRATSLCLHCGDMCCQSCANAHLRMSVSRSHKVESLASLTPEILSANRPALCSAHSDRPLELFCPIHGASICTLCTTTTHRKCQEVTTLETKARETRAALDDVLTQLDEVGREMDQTVHQLDNHLLVIDQNMHMALADISATCTRVENSFKNWRHRVEELVKEASSEEKAAVRAGRMAVLDQRAKLESNRRLTERVKQTTPPDKLDEMTNTLKTQITGHHTSSPGSPCWPGPTGASGTRSVTVSDVPAGATGTLSPTFNTALPQAAKRVRKLCLDPHTLNRIEEELRRLGHLVDEYTEPAHAGRGFRFHTNHGENIVLSDNHQTAERVAGDNGGIVLSNDPMVVSSLYEVEVTEKHGGVWLGKEFTTGVTSEDPASLTLPYWAYLWNSAHVIRGAISAISCSTTETNIGHGIWDLPVGGRVGVLVDSAASLHLYRDGNDLGVAVTGVKLPCYAFFDVRDTYRKIKALPVTVKT